jgi:hypothetical protein
MQRLDGCLDCQRRALLITTTKHQS